jgi:hypothetical protein
MIPEEGGRGRACAAWGGLTDNIRRAGQGLPDKPRDQLAILVYIHLGHRANVYIFLYQETKKIKN